MASYWLIKAILIISLVVVSYFLVRPVKSDSSLARRRIVMLLILLAAIFAIIFPGLFNEFARSIGVMSGTNLLVYLMVIVILAQMASNYRKDAQSQQKLTVLARKIALLEAERSAEVSVGPSTESVDAPAESTGPETRAPEECLENKRESVED